MEANVRPIVFLGGIFTPDQIDLIQAESSGVIQNAADALQKNLIRGLVANRQSLIVLNLPFVGSYPRTFRRPVFPATRETVFSKVPVEGRSFLLLRAIKSPSRLISAFRGLLHVARPRRSVIVVYSAHLPFMVAAIACRWLYRDTKICMVLPDLPEFMDEGGILYQVAKWVETRIFYRLARHIDGFVLLTRFMADRLQLSDGQYVVVEGIAEPATDTSFDHSGPLGATRRIFLYSGTLAARYGVLDLVQAFRNVRDSNAELWICGTGDSVERIRAAAREDSRIRYLGQVSRDEARKLQQQATVLVNPRRPEGDFTRYSFPSKTLEYMASGRPVLMNRLAGIPDEYTAYYFRPPSSDMQGLMKAIQWMVKCDLEEIQSMGNRARDFVLEQKNAASQCRKIVELIASFR